MTSAAAAPGAAAVDAAPAAGNLDAAGACRCPNNPSRLLSGAHVIKNNSSSTHLLGECTHHVVTVTKAQRCLNPCLALAWHNTIHTRLSCCSICCNIAPLSFKMWGLVTAERAATPQLCENGATNHDCTNAPPPKPNTHIPRVVCLPAMDSCLPPPTLAAGWLTSISRKIACPSFVSTMPAQHSTAQHGTTQHGTTQQSQGVGDMEHVLYQA
jgi:hypothetical protein